MMSVRRNFFYSLLVFIAIIALCVGAIWYELGRPEREVVKNPFMRSISQQTRQWDTRVNLAPEPLALGVSYKDVEFRLLAADFVLRTERQYLRRHSYGEEALSPEDESFKKQGEIVFSIDHGNYVCSIEYIAFLLFDEQEKLTSAKGMMSERGCL